MRRATLGPALLLLASTACDAEASNDTGPRVDASRDTGASNDSGALDGGRDTGTPTDAALLPGELPSGNTGIASHYPGDLGIAADPDVVFADDFESYADPSGLPTRWNAGVFHDVQLATEAAHVHRGHQALEFVGPMRSTEWSNTVARTLDREVDTLFLRYYAQFDANFDVLGSSHNGGGISAHYFVDGMATPGIRADGMNKFGIEYEAWRADVATANPGQLNVYIYHPEQRDNYGDHFFPDGIVLPDSSMPGNFGSEFIARPNVTPELGRWYSYEVMLQANTPGLRDGRIALWLDGTLIADFRNLRLRDVATLRIDRFNLSLHIRENTGPETHKWYDDVVAATRYIGPVFGG